MTERALITDEELHAYIDGELDSLRAADVELLLQYHPELQQKIEAFRADKAMIATAYGSLIDQPIPAAWHGMIARARSPARTQTSRRALFAIAASAAVTLVGVEAYRRLRPEGEDALVAEALAARNESFNLSFSGTNERDEADRTLKTALNLAVKTPDLAKYGFALARFRVYSGVSGGRAVKLDYTDAQQQLFTLYVRHSDGEERFEMLKRGPTRVCVWQDEVLSAVMLADVSAGEMLRLATLAYAGLSA